MADRVLRDVRQFSSIAGMMTLIAAVVSWWWNPAVLVALSLSAGFLLGHLDGRRVEGGLLWSWEFGESRSDG